MKLTLAAFLMLISLCSVSQDTGLLTINININDTVQRIRNIGASGCWFSEEIGKKWPVEKKQRIAELLFSRDQDRNGQPKGIGLSAFRYNIGAGTAEQGDSSGIKDPARRVECFLSPDGTYHWNKQEGYTWLLQQAKNYGVQNLVAFVNSPPVQFTKNGLGFKLEKDYSTNLKQDKVADYANFLVEVIQHFDKSKLHFDYISPVNEPQWDWSGTMGQAKQEGSPWTNREIYNTVRALDKALDKQKLTTQILMTEAGQLNHLYDANVKHASRQIAAFWDPASDMYIGGLTHTTPYVEGHSYFTEKGDAALIGTRSRLKDTLKKYGNGLEYWQSEYCMLGDGYKENTNTNRRSAIDCALFLAKVIHYDFTVGNATAWYYWNSFEPGPSDNNTRYYLIALNPARNADTSKLYSITKNLWALGHYSLLVRPGMYRLQVNRNDGLKDETSSQQIMVSAFRDAAKKTLVVNIINYTDEDKNAGLLISGLTKGNNMKLTKRYVTSAKEADDLKPYPVNNDNRKGSQTNKIKLPARSISSFVFTN